MKKRIEIKDLKPSTEDLSEPEMKQVRGGGVVLTGAD